ncbi:MAG TPA: SRPBCC domain-containing protein [Acidobacteriota bacterium]|nr:SRPBCC domain-containing protein [Acidobacteriota bacterium]
MNIAFKINVRIQKPIAKVFDAVVNPQKLSGYFTKTASAPLREGEKAIWRFPEFPDMVAEVSVTKVVANKLIRFEWASQEGGYNTRVEMKFDAIEPGNTLLTISESGWRETDKGLEASYGNCSGWMNMACCLKAYAEYGINLRKGAFHMDDFK